jgi:hypothetical protein
MSNSKGANSQAGFNAQNWAALSLFVQYSGYKVFQRIELEQPRLADFVLVFDDMQIICESKKTHITYADIREIFDTIPTVSKDDEILIICTSVGPRVKEDLDNAKYFPEVQEKLITKHAFTVEHIELIPKLKIWVVDRDMNEDIVRNLMAERFQSWLPDDELDDLVRSLLVKNIYEKSSKGGIYTKSDFNDELQKRKEALKQKDDYKHSERSAKETVNKLLSELKDTDSRIQSDNRLKAILADTGLHYFALQEITKNNKGLNLALWHNFWLATFSSYYSREVLRIFEENIKDEESAIYVVNFIKENVHKLRFKNMEEYEFKSTADILMKAVGITDKLLGDVFELLKRLYAYSTESPLFVEGGSKGRDEWLMGELANGFDTLYAKGEESLKAEIINYIYRSFDIVDEEYNRWHRTPFKFFEILREDLLAKPSSFSNFLEQVRLQYIDTYQRFKVKYAGWELMGGGTSNFGGEYEAHDRAFVKLIIRPHLNRLTAENQWKLIDKYAGLKVSDVSEYKPDFMNRAFIPFLIEQYAEGNKKAFKILSEFIKMRKGIPHKAELIFFSVRDSKALSTEQKWNLLNVAIKEFGFPINVFMDQVLWELLEKKHEESIKTFSELLVNKDYMNRQVLFDTTVIQSIMRLIGNAGTFDQGVTLLEEFLHGDYFKSIDSFHSYDAKSPILDVLNKDFDKGILLIRSLIAGKPLDNQQRVFGAVLRDTPDESIEKMYLEIVKPELDQAKEANELARKFTNIETRENFIWFGEKLSKKRKFEEAFYIANFFINDPSPELSSEYDKDVINGKYDFTINTVRGCIAWILLPVISVPGRPYLNQVFAIAKKLCTDESLYVRQLSLLLLESLANNRHTTMPDSKEWFMDYPTANAIEEFAFSMLRDESNYHNAIMRHLARVFNRIRTLNEGQAIEVIDTFVKNGDKETADKKDGDKETLKELDSLIIFLAEFRKGAFRNWPKARGIIPPYDPKPVQDKLKDFLENGSEEHRQSLVWHIVKLPEEPIRNNGDFDKFFNISMKYLPYALKRYDHHLFSHIHRFIEKYIDRKFNDCYKIWRKSLDVERPVILAESKKDQHPGEYNYWPYHYNGSILVKVLKNLGVEQFLKDLEFIVDYPDAAGLPYDFDKVLAVLEKTHTNKDDINRIYEKLIGKSYVVNNSYVNWLKVEE